MDQDETWHAGRPWPHCVRWKNMTLSIKPEVHNVVIKIKGQLQITHIENFAKFGHVVSEMGMPAVGQTDRQIDRWT